MNTCWICEDISLELVKKTDLDLDPISDQFKVSDSDYGKTGNLYRCSTCLFIQCFDFPDVSILYQNMSDDEYVLGAAARLKEMKKIVEFLLRECPDIKSLLDIGAGTGLLVRSALELGIHAKGMEPSNHFVGIAKGDNLNVIQGVYPHTTIDEKFDAITLVDVIEHVNTPLKFIEALQSNLNKDAVVLISTPDSGSVLARILKWKWWHYRIAHIAYFNKTQLDDAMARKGFELIAASRPSWYFDLDYLVARLIKFFLRVNVKVKFLERIHIKVNLHDSMLRIYRKSNKFG
jgi:SAM-dependent methyltransferase